ncbi:MAG: 6,7-dimethyl-8-ribityllumazine synthase [Gammaproteobacteria bacterium]|nr:6,7-dimethyl-8-ribityllumazine synthase [Gammaproteobacteria bacterium]MYF66981.1 6,7-dimethyl-8-ribityllumazine synthase [Gammaproteobacteria bacterium]MYK36413.1 6,7-dimethyl-8-ribityllumazine synthase [Gammaproteobacteria bacterium]
MAAGESKLKILIVTADYYDELGELLETGARERFLEAGVAEDRIVLRRVPGCWELPLEVRRLVRRHAPDAVAALGVLIRGETDHYDHIARECCAGLMRVGLDEDVHVALGVLTCGNRAQAEDRCGVRSPERNKGREAANAILRILHADS